MKIYTPELKHIIYTIEIGQQRIGYLTNELGSQDVKLVLYYISRPSGCNKTLQGINNF